MLSILPVMRGSSGSAPGRRGGYRGVVVHAHARPISWPSGVALREGGDNGPDTHHLPPPRRPPPVASQNVTPRVSVKYDEFEIIGTRINNPFGSGRLKGFRLVLTDVD